MRSPSYTVKNGFPGRPYGATKSLMDGPFPPDIADDPVWQAVLRAAPEDETPEEAAMVARAKALGGAVPSTHVAAELERRGHEECAAAGK